MEVIVVVMVLVAGLKALERIWQNCGTCSSSINISISSSRSVVVFLAEAVGEVQ